MFSHHPPQTIHLEPKTAKLLQPNHQQQQAPPRIRQQSASTTLPSRNAHNPSTTQNARQPGPTTPTCANCGTQTTPLWRRNQSGATLCNACALFQKMKGRPRPISLKTNVIKPRNRIKAIDKIPLARPTPLNQQELTQIKITSTSSSTSSTSSSSNNIINNNSVLSTSSSSNSSPCSTPIPPSLYHQLHPQQPNLIQSVTSPLNDPPSNPQLFKPTLHLLPPNPHCAHHDHHPKLSSHSTADSFRPISHPASENLLSASYPHPLSSRQPESCPLVRSAPKALPGGPDLPSLCPDTSVPSKRRKHSLRSTPTESFFPANSFPPGSPELINPHDPSAPLRTSLHPSDPRPSPPIPRHPQLSSSGDHHTDPRLSPSQRSLTYSNRESSMDRTSRIQEEREKGPGSARLDRFGHASITLPPLSQLTRQLKDPSPLQTSSLEPGPPKSFEASAREARLHSPVSPAHNLRVIPAGQSAEPRRALSVQSSLSESDSILSPIQLATPYTPSPPEPRLRPCQPITPPVLLGIPSPLHFHPHPSQPARRVPTSELAHGLSPHLPAEASHDSSLVPVEELCQLKKRIAELEIINGHMFSRLGELERGSKSPLSPSQNQPPYHQDHPDGHPSPSCPAVHAIIPSSVNHDDEEDEEYMIDDSF